MVLLKVRQRDQKPQLQSSQPDTEQGAVPLLPPCQIRVLTTGVASSKKGLCLPTFIYFAQNTSTATETERLSNLVMRITGLRNKAVSGQGAESRSISVLARWMRSSSEVSNHSSCDFRGVSDLHCSYHCSRQFTWWFHHHQYPLSQKDLKCMHDFFPGGNFIWLWKRRQQEKRNKQTEDH